MRSINAIGICLLLLWGCKSKKTTVQQDDSIMADASIENPNEFEPDPLEDRGACLPLALLQPEEISRASEWPTITNALVQDDCLYLKLEYSGCRKGKITVSWDKTVGYVNFPNAQDKEVSRIVLSVFVNQAGQCESIITDRYSVDLSSLKTVDDTILVWINDMDGPIPMIHF